MPHQHPLEATDVHTIAKPMSRIRVLHVLGGLNPGGVETWLLQVLQHIDRSRFQLDFWVHDTQACLYDAEVQALGSKIFIAPSVKSPWKYALALYRTLIQEGPFDIIHSHVHHFSGLVLKVARHAGVPTRIAHSHIDSLSLDTQVSRYRQFYLALSKYWIHHNATVGIGASGLAATALFGPNWRQDPRWQVLHCGINLTPFQETVDAIQLRESFEIPPDAFVIGHIGRFEDEKNHTFLVQLLAELLKYKPNTFLFLVGQGTKLPQIQAQARQLGISSHIRFAGVRRDVPQLLKGVMDLFMLPSLYEGLGLVLVEAQAAGLPCIISDTVPQEVDLVPHLITRYSLQAPLENWCKTILSIAEQSTLDSNTAESLKVESLKHVKKSAFNIDFGINALEVLYSEEIQ